MYASKAFWDCIARAEIVPRRPDKLFAVAHSPTASSPALAVGGAAAIAARSRAAAASVADRASDRSGALSDGTDTLTSVERLYFSDVKVALDLNGHAGQAARILSTVFGTAFVANRGYVGICLNLLDGGMNFEVLAGAALNAAGKTTNADVASIDVETVLTMIEDEEASARVRSRRPIRARW